MQLTIFGGLVVGLLLVIVPMGMFIVAKINHIELLKVVSMSPADYARPENASIIRGMLIVQFFAIFLIPALVFAYLSDPKPLAYAGLKAPQKNSFLWIAIVTMIVAYFTVEFLALVNESIVHILPGRTQQWILKGESAANGTLENILDMKNTKDLLLNIFLVGALPAIGEEIFFRGILQRIFIQIFKKAWPGIIFTGFLFSAFHMQFMGFLPRMALGIVLGCLYWFSGSLFTSMLGHFIFNSINILLIYFKVSDLDTKYNMNWVLILVGLLSILIVVALLNYLRKKSTTDYNLVYPVYAEPSIFDEPDRPQ